VEAAGIEPACDFDGKNERVCDCVNCEKCRAARALHSGRSNWLDLSSIDADLQSVVLGWEEISHPIRKAIVALATLERSHRCPTECTGD
jgi:hypothetical protein